MLSPPRRACIYRLTISSDENFSSGSLCHFKIAQDPVVGWPTTEKNHLSVAYDPHVMEMKRYITGPMK